MSSDTVLVTGGRGFLGRHVVDELRARGADAVATGSADANLVDPLATRALFERVRPRRVVHLAAAVGGIHNHRERPGWFCFANAMMASHVLEAARVTGVAKVLVVGSAASYAESATIPTPESEWLRRPPAGATAHYAMAKVYAWALGRAYAEEYGLAVNHVVLTNVYGPHDHFDDARSHVVAALVRRFVEAASRGAKDVLVWGDGRASRDFLYVADAARGLVEILDRHDSAEPLNLGSGREVTIRELAETLRETAGFGGELRFDPGRPQGAPRRALDITRIRDELGFEPGVSLVEGLARTVAWYRDHPVTT